MLFFLMHDNMTINGKASFLPAEDLTDRMHRHAHEGMLCLVG